MFLCVILAACVTSSPLAEKLKSRGAPIPPETRPAPGRIEPMAPEIRVQAGRVELENAHALLAFAGEGRGLALTRLFHKHAAAECLVPGQTCDVFAVLIGDRLLTSNQFKAASVETFSDAKARRVEFTLQADAPRLEAKLGVRLDASPDLLWSLEVVNKGDEPRTMRVFFPLLTHLLIGSDADDNYYFYPFKGGWCGNAAYHLGHGYGTPTGSLQLMALFNPLLGSGVSMWVKDASGAMKSFWLRKVDRAGQAPPAYESLRDEMKAKALPFDLAPGVSMAFSPLPTELKPNETLRLPDAVVSVYAGDWHEALQSYAGWVRTWWTPPKVPMWLRRCFNVSSAHDTFSKRQGRYCAVEKLLPRHHMIQWAFWWRHSDTDRLGLHPKPGRWFRNTHGDYDYEPRWGGLKGLKAEIDRLHRAGTRLQLYVQSYLVWKHSRLGKEHGDDWVARTREGKPRIDWTGEHTNMDVWDFCVGCKGYQDYLAATCRRILADTGADGIYLDSAADAYPCYDPRHGHGREPARFSLEMLRKLRPAIKQADPDAILQIEDVCSEHHMQFIDGAWLKEFEMYAPLSKHTPHFDAYPVYFLRFYFPELWFADWGSGDDPIGWRRCFFNGMGVSKWPGPYMARAGRVLRENAAAFASLHPQPIVPTGRRGLFLNVFPIEAKTLYMVYNRNAERLSGPLLTVEHREGFHYVELLSGEEVRFDPAGGRARLWLDAPAGEVLAVAQLPRKLEVAAKDGALAVRVNDAPPSPRVVLLTSDDPDDLGVETPLREGKAEFRLSQLKRGEKRATIKLFSGEELVDSMSWRTADE